MVNRGLDIGLEEFKRMKSIDRDVLVYNNLLYIRTKVGDYKLHTKLTYCWLIGLSAFMGLKKVIGF